MQNRRNGENGTWVSAFKVHTKPHAEEQFAMILARLLGRNAFPGAHRARIVERDGRDVHNLIHSPEWHLAELGELWIGTGGGESDEHGKEYDDDKERCSANLIAEKLGVQDRPRIKEILTFLAHEDREGGSTPFDITQCVKRLNDAGWSPDRVQEWFKVFVLLYLDINRTFPVLEPKHRNLLDLFKRWLVKNRFVRENEDISVTTKNNYVGHMARRIMNLCKEGAHQPNPDNPTTWIYDIMEAVALINSAYPNDPEVAYTWVSRLFDAELSHQREYLAAVDLLHKQPPVFVNISGRRLRIIIAVNTENICIPDACRKMNPPVDIVIIRRKTGNTAIMLRNRKLSLKMTALALRLEEQIANGIPNELLITDYIELGRPGRQDGSEAWYIYTDRFIFFRALFNGSKTYPMVIPTKLELYRVRSILEAMLSVPEDEATWKGYVASRLIQRQHEANTAVQRQRETNARVAAQPKNNQLAVSAEPAAGADVVVDSAAKKATTPETPLKAVPPAGITDATVDTASDENTESASVIVTWENPVTVDLTDNLMFSGGVDNSGHPTRKNHHRYSLGSDADDQSRREYHLDRYNRRRRSEPRRQSNLVDDDEG